MTFQVRRTGRVRRASAATASVAIPPGFAALAAMDVFAGHGLLAMDEEPAPAVADEQVHVSRNGSMAGYGPRAAIRQALLDRPGQKPRQVVRALREGGFKYNAKTPFS